MNQDQLETGRTSREVLRQRLRELASAPVPTELGLGAMCYSPTIAPTSASYDCPVCGAKTLHSFNAARIVQDVLPAARRIAEGITGLGVRLDAQEFCMVCSPGTTDPKLAVEIDYLEGPHRFSGVGIEDLRLIQECVEGSRVHRNNEDFESPLRDNLPRLRLLLGMEADG